MKLQLVGDIPSKKNGIIASKGRRGTYGSKVGATLKNLILQVRAGWRDGNGPLGPVLHPEMRVRMFIFNPKKDQDGIWTTVLDALKKGGVVIDDSIEFCNGRKIFEPVEMVTSIRDERVEIDITSDARELSHGSKHTRGKAKTKQV